MYQYPRGVNNSSVILDIEFSPTISCSSWQNNCVLIEIMDDESDTEVGTDGIWKKNTQKVRSWRSEATQKPDANQHTEN